MRAILASLIASLSFVLPVRAATPMQNGYFYNINTIKLIQCVDSDGDHFSGTGFVIGKNRVATAAHVIYGATSCVVDHKPMSFVTADTEMDFAVVAVDLGDNPPVAAFSCEGYTPGEVYFSIGWSRGQDEAVTKLVATGETAEMHATGEYPYKTADLQILKGLMFAGMSGGPIIDMNGRVVGVNNTSDERTEAGSRPLADTKLCSALRAPKPAMMPAKPAEEPNAADKVNSLLDGLKK